MELFFASASHRSNKFGNDPQMQKKGFEISKPSKSHLSLWELTDSNRRPSACKADALNQLS